jgi:hypothetical protein
MPRHISIQNGFRTDCNKKVRNYAAGGSKSAHVCEGVRLNRSDQGLECRENGFRVAWNLHFQPDFPDTALAIDQECHALGISVSPPAIDSSKSGANSPFLNINPPSFCRYSSIGQTYGPRVRNGRGWGRTRQRLCLDFSGDIRKPNGPDNAATGMMVRRVTTGNF